MKSRFILGLLLVGLALTWFFVNKRHNFNNAIPTPTKEEVTIFQNVDETTIYQVYSTHFNNPKFHFPRTAVSDIRLYKNNIFKAFTCKRLKPEFNDSLTSFFNNPSNFDWGETTWQHNEAEYILKFLDKKQNLVGQIYLCLNECGYLDSSPFTPNMKFGQITDPGLAILTKFINEKDLWK